MGTRRPNHATRRTGATILSGLAALALAGTAVAAPTGSAGEAPRLIKAHKWLSTECITQQTASGRVLVRAKVTVRMTVVNYRVYNGTSAQRMKLRARIVSGTGINIHRDWKEAHSGSLVQGRRYAETLSVTTDNFSPTADKKVQIRMIWDRPAPLRNVVVNDERELRCQSGNYSGA
jgi:hypothetical protein